MKHRVVVLGLVLFLLLAATAGATAPSGRSAASPPSIATYRAELKPAIAQLNRTGDLIAPAIKHAPKKSDAQLRKQFARLTTGTRAAGRRIAKITPPTALAAKQRRLVTTIAAAAHDLGQITEAARLHSGSRAERATRHLVVDSAKVRAAGRALATAVNRGGQLAATITPGRYAGSATPGTTMRVTVTKAGHVDFKIRPRSKCSQGGTRLGVSGPNTPPKITAAGTFHYRETGHQFAHRGGTYRYRIAGKVTATRATGTYRGVDHFADGSVCTAKVRWSAVRR